MLAQPQKAKPQSTMSDTKPTQFDDVVVYDTLSNKGTMWSHHLLRVVLALDYKQIPYSIKSIQYPDFVSTFAATPLQPKADPIEPYETPVLEVHDADAEGGSRFYMGTTDILGALEAMQPERPLLYASPRSVEFRSLFGPAFAPILQSVVGHVPQILPQASVQAFTKKRADRWGKTVEQWIIEHPTDEALAKASNGLRAVGDWLELTPGPFVHGDAPSYADFTAVSVLLFVKEVGFPDLMQAVLRLHPALERLFCAVEEMQPEHTEMRRLFHAGE